MHEVSARAALVPAPNVGDGLSTTVAREEVADALRADGPVELILDVTGYSSEGQPTETQQISVWWERPDLERLLEGSGDRIELTFDREAIEQAIGDVDAHGLREKALVFAVAITAAAGSAAAASGAEMIDTAGGTGSGTSSYMTTQDTGVQPGVPASLTSSGVDDTAGTPVPPALTSSGIDDTANTPVPPALTSSGVDDTALATTGNELTSPGVAGEAAKTTPSTPAPTLSPDDRAVDFSSPSPTLSVSPDDRAVDFSSPSATPSVSPDDRAVDFSTPGLVPSVGPDDRAFDRSSPEPATPVASIADDGGISLEAPSPEAVALGGAIALAITAAGFAVAGRRRVTPAQ